MSNFAYVTLLTGESYLPGVLTLGQKLKELGTKHKLIILLDSSSISEENKEVIQAIYDEIISIDDEVISAPLEKVQEKLDRSELSITFSKILLWNLTQYDELVYLDADVLPLQNLDELFESFELKDGEIAASPDSGWPDIFNSGVLKIKPSSETFEKLIEFSSQPENTFDGADQGLLNEYFGFKNWVRLPYLFNVTPNYRQDYQYLPAFHRFFNQIRILHYIGAVKPWHYGDILSSDLANFHQYWWDDFNRFFGEDVHLKYKLLNLPRGEASNLKFGKQKNAWDADFVGGSGSTEAGESHAAVFPWEHREEKREATRVFHPTTASSGEAVEEGASEEIHEDLKKNIEALSNVKVSKDQKKSEPLSKNYGFEKEGNKHFNPEKSLSEVAKLPFKFFSRKKEEK
ncbi:Glycogenin-1 [Spathaspora sp. JA1]|nr:Glycogenin-1 [Spathaspora sp. JA1]